MEMTSNGIRKIEPGAFRNVPKLQHLNLSGNLLEEIGDGVFTNLSLRMLDLANNKIYKLGEKAFNNMSLTYLSLDNNKISIWDGGWFNGTPVTTITMANNLLEGLPANTFKFTLELKHTSVKYTIKRLILSGNKLERIDPNAFKDVNHLGFVSLKNNSIEKLPLNVFESVQISTLDLSHNKITQLDEAFKYVNIDHLDLRHNNMNCLPFDFLETSRIYYIYIDGNPLVCECVEMWKEWQQKFYVKIISWNDKTCIR
ncbi:LRR 8 domain containing protein [Asbolus verrucosus]|uniref:LRR 8 domain containing protein n=1 Tax=Asbolus verrucosus TaxID=1661398 RepID=A0A482W1J2_ASBVE|nr:LRR 8 domain containing protein [Asbolus verrucosus]